MSPQTDLTWVDLNNAFGVEIVVLQNVNKAVDPAGNRAYIDLSVLLNTDIQSLTDRGVIKALVKLLETGRNAQERINEGKPAGERIAAFAPPVIGGHSNGFVPVTRSIASRYELDSAVSIVATTA